MENQLYKSHLDHPDCVVPTQHQQMATQDRISVPGSLRQMTLVVYHDADM